MVVLGVDPGSRYTGYGIVEVEGETYEVVELTFDDVGLTPQNKYRGWVDPETHRMAYWQHYTEASDEEPQCAPPVMPTPLEHEGLLDLFKGEDVGRDVELIPATQEDMCGGKPPEKESLEVVYDDA